jgi:UDP-glucuronate 4-epimerase
MGKCKILFTGIAGLIEYHLCILFLRFDYKIIGINSLNRYYDAKLKLFKSETRWFIQGKDVKKGLLGLAFLSKDISISYEADRLFLEHKFG